VFIIREIDLNSRGDWSASREHEPSLRVEPVPVGRVEHSGRGAGEGLGWYFGH